MKKRICITGATGTMGMATLREFAQRTDRFAVTVLARPGKVNRRKLQPFMSLPDFKVEWGDLCLLADVERAVADADYVLHMGGMVSPAADYFPEKTLKVNVEGSRNVARAVLNGSKADTVAVVYVGSVAQLGDRRPPIHWGRTGDPLDASVNDAYALSKIEAELAIVDSGLKRWVSLRQTGILCPSILFKGSDPITFHVPLRGMLEWTTDEDSGRLMANVCEDSVPEEFWNKFYNIGSGESYRLTNFEFERLMLKALRCPPPEKVFEPHWFATRNFHGQWWADSDRLEALVPFRSGETVDDYFMRLRRMVPWYFRLAPLAPARLIKWGMKQVAKKKPLGPLYWLRTSNTRRLDVHFGGADTMKQIPSWSEQLHELENYPGEPRGSRVPPREPAFGHGYDETKPLPDITDMRSKAAHHGGKCLTESMTPGNMSQRLLWECRAGHRFEASPAAVLLGGHWCPHCLREKLGFGNNTLR